MSSQKTKEMERSGNFWLSCDIKEAMNGGRNAAEGLRGLSWRTDYD